MTFLRKARFCVTDKPLVYKLYMHCIQSSASDYTLPSFSSSSLTLVFLYFPLLPVELWWTSFLCLVRSHFLLNSVAQVLQVSSFSDFMGSFSSYPDSVLMWMSLLALASLLSRYAWARGTSSQEGSQSLSSSPLTSGSSVKSSGSNLVTGKLMLRRSANSSKLASRLSRQ